MREGEHAAELIPALIERLGLVLLVGQAGLGALDDLLEAMALLGEPQLTDEQDKVLRGLCDRIAELDGSARELGLAQLRIEERVLLVTLMDWLRRA